MMQISNYVNVVRNHLQEIWGTEEQIKSSQESKQINPDEGHSRESVTELWQKIMAWRESGVVGGGTDPPGF